MAVGKVGTGFSHPWVAAYSATGGVVTYSNAMALGRGVSMTISPESSDDNIFYADNVAAETAPGTFTGGTATVVIDGLLEETETFIFGLPEAATVGTVSVLKYGDSAQPPYIALGGLIRHQNEGEVTWSFAILTKMRFSLPTTEASTQEDSISWQTQSLEATIMRDDTAEHAWKMISATEYNTEAAALTAMKKVLGVA